MKATCKYCLIEFEAKRNTAMFCSASHRVMFNNLRPAEITMKEAAFKEHTIGLFLSECRFNLAAASTIPPKPIIDNECRQVKDYCKENGLSVDDLIEAHVEIQKIKSNKPPTISQKREKERETKTESKEMPDFKSRAEQMKWMKDNK